MSKIYWIVEVDEKGDITPFHPDCNFESRDEAERELEDIRCNCVYDSETVFITEARYKVAWKVEVEDGWERRDRNRPRRGTLERRS